MLKLFDFKCQDCGKDYEQLVSNPADIKTVCPECGSFNTARTWTKSSFKVHGQGAYNNKMVI